MNPYIFPGIAIKDKDMTPDQILVEVVKFAEEKKNTIVILEHNTPYSKRRALYPITLDSVSSKSRYLEFVMTRAIFYYIIRIKFPRFSYEKAGSYVGGRTHATVINGIRTLKDICDTNKEVKKTVNAFLYSIGVSSIHLF